MLPTSKSSFSGPKESLLKLLKRCLSHAPRRFFLLAKGFLRSCTQLIALTACGSCLKPTSTDSCCGFSVLTFVSDGLALTASSSQRKGLEKPIGSYRGSIDSRLDRLYCLRRRTRHLCRNPFRTRHLQSLARASCPLTTRCWSPAHCGSGYSPRCSSRRPSSAAAS